MSQTFVYDTILALERDAGYQCTVLTAWRTNAACRPFHSIALLRGFDVVVGIAGRGAWKRGAACLAPAYRRAFARRLRSVSPDVLHCHFGWAGVAALRLFGGKPAIPMLVSLHGTDILHRPQMDLRYRDDLLRLAARADVLFTVPSRFLARAAAKVGIADGKIRLHHNAVHPRFRPDAQARHPAPRARNPSAFHIANVARFETCKGHAYLVEAFGLFAQRHPEARLTLVGDGETQCHLRSAVQAAGLAARVHFAGEVANERLPALLDSVDVYVQPSIVDPQTGQTESFGVSVLEAISRGVPVIVTATGGLPEIVSSPTHANRCYRVVPPASAPAIDEALEAFATVWPVDMATYARQKAEEFSPGKHVARLTDLYAQLQR